MDDDVVARLRASIAAGDWDTARLALHPYLHWTDGTGATTRGRRNVLDLLHLDADAAPPPGPASVELRDGQIYRWTARQT